MAGDVGAAIKDAIEASYYCAPESPGLNEDELHAVLAPLGYGAGEIRDALRSRLGNEVCGSPTGFQFTREGLPIWLTEHWIPSDGDPRDWDVFTFVHGRLKQLAKDKGLAEAKLGIGEIHVEAEARRLDRVQVARAIYGLPLMNLAKLENNTLVLTHQGNQWADLNTRHVGGRDSHPRPNFIASLKRVANVLQLRDPTVRWQTLRAELTALGPGDALKADEARILGDICAHFADSGEAVSLDDALRRMTDLDVRAIAQGQLEQNQLIHSCSDARVVPTLLAVARYLDLFGPLLQLVDEALKRARELWEQKNTIVQLRGVHGVVRPTGTRNTRALAEKQLVALVDGLSLRPVVVPNSGDRVDLRDEIRNTSSVAGLVTYQRRNYLRRPPVTVLLGPTKAPEATTSKPEPQRPPMPPTKSSSVNILFLDLSGWSRLDPLQITNYLEKALPRLSEIVAKFHCTHVNTWGDALVATFGSAQEAAECALDIRDMFRRGTERDGIPRGLVPRISLHQGEVIVAYNPIIKREDVFGDAVHLAARLEPVTAKGQIYCTKAFADALDPLDGIAGVAHEVAEIEMAKSYGKQLVFVVTGPNEDPPVK